LANAYPRESVEFQPVKVTRDGSTVTEDLSYAVVLDGHRPETFTPATIVGTDTGVMVSGLAPGTYRIYAKMTAGPEIPVIDCGYFYIY
jgi:hypothetical protein